MKTTKTLALIGGLGLLAAAALAQPAPGDNSGPLPPPDRFGGGRPDPETFRRMLTEKFDANKDGKLDDSELATLGKDVVEGRFGPQPGMNRRGPQGQGGPGFGGGPRAQGPGDDTARVWDSPNGGPRAQGPGGFDGDRPPLARRPGGQGIEGDRPPGAPGAGQPAFSERGGPDGGPPPRAPRPDREDGSGRGQFAPGPGGPGNRNGEFGKTLETRRREFIKKYDADGDGKLSSSEREAIGRDIEEGKLPPPPLAPPYPPRAPQQPPPPRQPE